MKKLCIAGLGGVILLALAFLATRPPLKWNRVAFGMSRSEVYSLVGQPHTSNELTKGGVRWRSGAFVGRWEFDVFFRADDTVNQFGKRWRWNWW